MNVLTFNAPSPVLRLPQKPLSHCACDVLRYTQIPLHRHTIYMTSYITPLDINSQFIGHVSNVTRITRASIER